VERELYLAGKAQAIVENGKPELNSSWQFIHMAFPAI